MGGIQVGKKHGFFLYIRDSCRGEGAVRTAKREEVVAGREGGRKIV
jgi:hypothetical protein